MSGMDPERWRQVRFLFETAIELDENKRQEFVRRECGGDEEIFHEVMSLLENHVEAEDFLEDSPVRGVLGRVEGEDEAVAELDRLAGHRFGAYRIVELIARGGMGEVYRAERADGAFDKTVALKVLQPGSINPAMLRRFKKERQILAALEHPNIARLIDGGTEGNVPYCVMEYVEGEPLDRYCDDKRLSVEQRLELVREVCAAVQFAHERDIVHRDLKPGNVLVRADGTVKLLDFGIAKLLGPEGSALESGDTTMLMPALTPAYASPEQFTRRPVSPASDVYSLGVMLYELVSGRRPASARTTSVSVPTTVPTVEPPPPSAALSLSDDQTTTDWPRRQVQTSRPMTLEQIAGARSTSARGLRRELRGDLDRIVLKAMRLEPERRYSTAGDLAEDVERFLEHVPVVARAGERFYRASRLLQAHRQSLQIAAVVALAALVILVVWLGGGQVTRLRTIDSWSTVATTGAVEHFGRVSPDGTHVAYVSDRGGRDRLWVTEVAADAQPWAATDFADWIGAPVWSRDGRTIAYLMAREGETVLSFVRPDRSTPPPEQVLGSTLDLEIARWVGDWIFLRHGPAVAKVSVADRAVAAVSTSPAPQQDSLAEGSLVEVFRDPQERWIYNFDISWDGSRIVYEVSGALEDVWIVSLDAEGHAGAPNPLLDSPVREFEPRFADDSGNRILFLSNGGGDVDIWEHELTAPEPRSLGPSPNYVEADVDASADGRTLVAESRDDRANLYRLDPEAKIPRSLTRDAARDYWPQATRSGRVLFNRVKPLPGEPSRVFDMSIYFVDEGALTGMIDVDPLASGFGQRLSPDEAWLAYVTRRVDPGKTGFNVWLQKIATRNERYLVDSAYSPGDHFLFPSDFSHTGVAWSPDGELFLATRDSGGRGIILRVIPRPGADPDVDTAVQPSPDGGGIFDVQVDGAGERLAWVRASGDGVSAVCVIDLEDAIEACPWRTDELYELLLEGWVDPDDLVVVSRGGRSANSDVRLHRLRLDAGPVLEDLGLIEAASPGAGVVDRRRGFFYYTSASSMRIHNIVRVDLRSGEREQITSNNHQGITYSGLALTPEGHLLLTEQERMRDLHLIRLSSGR